MKNLTPEMIDKAKAAKSAEELIVYTVNHGIRGQEAERDASFVQDLCARLAVPCRCHTVNAPLFAKEHGLTLEEAARTLRYRVFDEAIGLDGLIITKLDGTAKGGRCHGSDPRSRDLHCRHVHRKSMPYCCPLICAGSCHYTAGGGNSWANFVCEFYLFSGSRACSMVLPRE